MSTFHHLPIMLESVVSSLVLKKDGKYLDCTFGRGGHSKEILKNLSKEGKLIAIDKDLEAIKEGKRIKDSRFFIQHTSIQDFANKTKEKFDGIFMDLGVSSPQLDDSSRGFSFMKNGPLDMRMNQLQTLTAQNVVNDYEEESLIIIFKNYGEERFAKKIAKNICKARLDKPIETTSELSEIVKKSVPQGGMKKHPATKVFQAIRIEVNHELEELENSIPKFFELLNSNGRLAILTFHSLEDRIVKAVFNSFAKPKKDDIPRYIPIRESDMANTVKAKNILSIIASEEEIKENIRSRSARLRVIEKI